MKNVNFKTNVNEILPYDRGQYMNFLDDDFHSSVQWYGVSFQMNREEHRNDVMKFMVAFEPLFKKLISSLDTGSYWIVNHEDKDLYWLPNEGKNLTSLRALFRQNEVPGTFRGALVLKKEDLFKHSKDFLSYPFAVLNKEALLYKNLNISHAERQLMLKISGHLTLDVLTTEKLLLKEIMIENASDTFVIKEYRSTLIDSLKH